MMQVILQAKKLFFLLSYVVNIILVFQVYAGLYGWDLYFIFNSDGLYLPSIYKDLFEDRTGLEGWHLNASPNFFPEWPLYFLIRYFSNDFRVACVIYSAVSLFIINILTTSIIKQVFKKIDLGYLILANLNYTLILLIYFSNRNFILPSLLFMTGYHVGVFIMSLLSFLLFFIYLNSKKNIYLILLFLVVSLGTLSDRFLIVFFVAPVLTSLIFVKTPILKKVIIYANISNIVAAFMGMLIYKLLSNSDYIYFVGLGYRSTNFSNIIPAFNSFIQTINQLLFMGNAISGMMILSFIALLMGLYYSSTFVFTKQKMNTVTTIERLLVLIFSSFIVIVAITPIINGTFLGQTHLRYNIYAFFIADCLLVIILFLIFRNSKKLNVITNYVAIALVFLVIISIIKREVNINSMSGLTTVFNYYPEDVAVIDSIAKKHNLSYGVGNYWNAKRTTMFSKENIRIYAVNKFLSPWFHVTNKHWYYRNKRGVYGNPKFTFILMNDIEPDKASFEIFNGKADTLMCNDIQILKVPEFGFTTYYRPFLLNQN